MYLATYWSSVGTPVYIHTPWLFVPSRKFRSTKFRFSMYCSCSILNLVLLLRGVWHTVISIFLKLLWHAPVFMSRDADAWASLRGGPPGPRGVSSGTPLRQDGHPPHVLSLDPKALCERLTHGSAPPCQAPAIGRNVGTRKPTPANRPPRSSISHRDRIFQKTDGA